MPETENQPETNAPESAPKPKSKPKKSPPKPVPIKSGTYYGDIPPRHRPKS